MIYYCVSYNNKYTRYVTMRRETREWILFWKKTRLG